MRYFLLMIAVVMVGCGKKDSLEPQVKIAKASKVDVNATATPKTQPKVEAKNPQPSKAIPANIDDPILEKAIREEFNMPTGELTQLTQVDLEKVTELNFTDKKLTELPKGLENLTQLKVLWLFDNQLTDVKGLEKLTKLEVLYLSGNQLTDVTGLENLTQLTYLTLGANKLTEVPKGLEKLTQLESLNLVGNQLTKVKGLEKLTQLRLLVLGKNQLTNVKGLENLTQLTELHLEDNPRPH